MGLDNSGRILIFTVTILTIIISVYYVTPKLGDQLLVYQDYTFEKLSNARDGGARFICTKRQSKDCKAVLHIDRKDTIVYEATKHTHKPEKFIQSTDGRYIKVKRFATMELLKITN